MSRTTRATLALDKAGVAYGLHAYDYDADAQSIGLHAAQALGISPERMLKTLMVLVDGKPACVVTPSDREVSMKKVAAAFGGKSAQMMKPADAERITGYHVGGISPLGQKRPVRTVVEASAEAHGTVFLNAGQRGLQVEMSPKDLVLATAAAFAPLA